MIDKVISGGQTGVDIAGLRAAKRCHISTGGFIPKGYKTLDGPKPEYEDIYNLVELDSELYPPRTRLNVQSSDCTIRFAFDFGTPGERLTNNYLNQYKKPYLDIGTNRLNQDVDMYQETVSEVTDWIINNGFRIINIAGNSEQRYKGIENLVFNFLIQVFGFCREDEDE